jgi:type I restriction enzyme M protein
MSERRRGLPEPVARLLRGLAAPAADEVALDRVPDDFALPDAGCTVVHAAVEFSGTVAAAALPPQLRTLTRSRRRDLAGIAWVLLALAPQGRAAVLVPEGFLTGTTGGHLLLRRHLVEQGRLQGVIRLAPGCCQPRAGAAVLLIGAGDAGPVWFGEITDRRDLTGPADAAAAPIVARWRQRQGAEAERPRTAASFVVPRAEIAAALFGLSVDRYRTAETAADAAIPPPHELLAELAGLEAEIFQGMRELAGMLRR